MWQAYQARQQQGIPDHLNQQREVDHHGVHRMPGAPSSMGRAGLQAMGVPAVNATHDIGRGGRDAVLDGLRLELDIDTMAGAGADSTVQVKTGPQGSERKEIEDARFVANPMVKYNHVLRVARRELGTQMGPMMTDDAATMRLFFREYVPLKRFVLASHMLELLVEMHRAALDGSAQGTSPPPRLLGLIAAGYQFIEQYVIDDADCHHGWMATHLPQPQNYTATGSGGPVGKLMQRSVTSATTAHDKEVETLTALKASRKKKGGGGAAA